MSYINYSKSKTDDSLWELERAKKDLESVSGELETAISRLMGAKGVEYLNTGSVTSSMSDINLQTSNTSSLIRMIQENQNEIEEFNKADDDSRKILTVSLNGLLNLNFNYPDQENMVIYFYKDKSGGIFPCYVTDTARNPVEYAEHRAKNVNQEKGVCKGKCMDLSFYYIMEMMSNHEYAKEVFRKLKCSPEIQISKRVISKESDGPSEAYEFIFQELKEGHPVGVQVTGTSELKRHWVTAVGYSCDVEDASELNADNLFVIDCYNGEFGRLSDFNRDILAWSSSKKKDKVFQVCGPSDKYLANDAFINRYRAEQLEPTIYE
ncbi:MAG: hypothetical protein J6X28_01310 [Bacilli bacterium]|nr:hypothetical protein [Bacilli bacterium]